MKKFNKIVSLLLALVMVLSLAACGGKTTPPQHHCSRCRDRGNCGC